MLNFKEYGAPPAVAIWEYYLIFATAFGISDVVLKEIRENYINMGSEPCWETFNICEKIVKSDFGGKSSGPKTGFITLDDDEEIEEKVVSKSSNKEELFSEKDLASLDI